MAELQKLLETEVVSKMNVLELSKSFKDHVKTTGSPAVTGNANLNNINTTATITTSTNANINNSNSIMDNGYRTNTTTTTTANANNKNLNGASNLCNEKPKTTNANMNANLNTSTNINEQESPEFFYIDPRANRLADIQTVLSQVKETPSELRRQIIDHATDVITEAHMATTLNTAANLAAANERISRQQGLPPQGMADVSKMKMDPQKMMGHFLNSMTASMARVVDFAKQLPGFCDVDTDDQVRLIRQGIFEVMVARITLLVDHVNDSMMDPSLKMKSPRAGVRKMSPLGPFIDSFFDVAKKTNLGTLTDGENGMFGAILLLCPDRQGLKNSSAIDKAQRCCLQALYMLLRKNHKDAEEKFTSLISSISAIRKINDGHFRFVNSIKEKSPEMFAEKFPALHKELFDISTH